jgi:hypothetical protein
MKAFAIALLGIITLGAVEPVSDIIVALLEGIF